MDWVTEQIAIGSQQEAQDARTLTDAGVRAVLNVGIVPVWYGPPVEEHAHIALLDGRGNNPRDLAEAVATLDRFVLERGRVLVHCLGGWSRSPCVVACYLWQRQHMELEAALDLIRSRRPVIQIKPELLEFVRQMRW
ncbi:MAG: dual specificity protein phosphatase family protein [Chloroflexi bacterium]|nr:dual specificity protein phosphatase family protein [Chloroflexota bacterium]